LDGNGIYRSMISAMYVLYDVVMMGVPTASENAAATVVNLLWHTIHGIFCQPVIAVIVGVLVHAYMNDLSKQITF
jgi:hypothetical protein